MARNISNNNKSPICHGWPQKAINVASCNNCRNQIEIPTKWYDLDGPYKINYCSKKCKSKKNPTRRSDKINWDSNSTSPEVRVNRILSVGPLNFVDGVTGNKCVHDPHTATAIMRKTFRKCVVCDSDFLFQDTTWSRKYFNGAVYFFCQDFCQQVFDLTPWKFEEVPITGNSKNNA